MKKRRTQVIILFFIALVVWRAWPAVWVFTGLNLKVSSDFSQIRRVLPPEARPLVALDGLSHPDDSRDLWNELLFRPRRIIHGHAFTSEPREVDTLISEVAATLSELGSIRPWSSGKNCGGFHADYYLLWKDDSQTWEALVCTGCYEVIFYHDGLSLRCDLTYRARKRIEAAEQRQGEHGAAPNPA